MRVTTALMASTCLVLASCGQSADQDTPEAAISAEQTLMTQLIDAQPGDVIEIPEGTLKFDRGLSLTVDGVTLRGQGMDKSVLSFADQIAGAEGLLVTASDFTIEDLAIEDAKGDALKINEGDNITIRRVRTEWTNGPSQDNGAYGIYPVQTTNVLVEENVAIGASDAGVYVGQSRDVIVRNNRAEYNVAGIEIENTVGADVYDNIATNNTGGILVFNMPQLQQEGRVTRVYDNQVFANNTGNFGHPGTPVASVPAGTGIIVNSNDDVEIFNNEISDNKTGNIIISSLFSTGYSESSASESFDPYPEGIFIYGNTFSGGGDDPDTDELALARVMLFGTDGRLPDIIWDGFYDEGKQVDGEMPAALRICIDNGEVGVLNANGPSGYTQPSTDVSAFQCELDKLPAVDLGRS
ncbi:MAG: right-handed parallel beta-helix repeat-containing protein [Henriciella sp.]|nr:right-handed parallel beta-helix repeat-containing protein [Henriciella sp.]